MKWRKLIALSTSSSPPKSGSCSSRPVRRRTTFEALENRKLFAIDLAEAIAADDSVAEVAVAELFSTEAVPVDRVAIDMVAIDMVAIDPVELSDVKFGETDMIIQPDIWTFGAADPEIRMMTFRGIEVEDGQAKSEEVSDDSEVGSPIMYMTGAVGGFDDVDVRTLDTDVDLSATSVMVEDPVAIDEAITDEDLIFYTLGSGSEVETTSVEESLTAEDVNGDGNVTALDMLLVINALNSYGAMPSSQLIELPEMASLAGNWDINRDGYVTPLDALLLTNYFNTDGAVASIESSQDALVAPMIARIREPMDDELGDEPVDVSLEEELT